MPRISATAAFLTISTLRVLGQSSGGSVSGPPQSATTGMQNYIRMVANLDKSVAFYREGLGLTLNGPVRDRGADPRIQKMTNTPGSRFRAATFKIPAEFGFELAEFTGIKRTPVRTRVQDPPSSVLSFTVRDLDTTLAALKKAGATVVSVGGQPVYPGRRGAKAKNIVVRDMDGLFVELFQPDEVPPGDGNVIAVRIALTSRSSAKTLGFYGQLLGFTVMPAEGPVVVQALEDLVDAPAAKILVDQASIPGTTTRWSFVEYQGVDHKPARPSLQDPGACAFSLMVRDLAALARSLKTAGVEIITQGGEPVMSSPNAGNIFVRDPNGFILELIQRDFKP